MSEVNYNEFSPENLKEFAEKWSIPATFIRERNSKLRYEERFLDQKIEDIKPENEIGTAQIIELRFATHPQERVVSASFILDVNPENYDVITAGPHMWSQPANVKTSDLLTNLLPLPTNRVIGRRPLENSLEDKRYGYYEPGFDRDKNPSNQEGRSYGFVAFRHKQTGENLMLGMIPNLDTFEKISYKAQDGKFVVSVQKDFEGITTPRESAFRVFLGSVAKDQEKGNYASLLKTYAKELAKIKGGIPLLENRVIGFSWPAYGHHINQKIISGEIKASEGIVDIYIIDAGWAGGANPDNAYQVDTKKFPDLPGLAQEMRQAGIKPGIWITPFAQYSPNKTPNFLTLLQDKNGRAVKSPFPTREDYKFPVLAKSFFGKNPASLDISVPAVRKYISEQFVFLAKMGFEVFKLDFLSHAFAGKMANNDKTSVEYYRQTFQEIREKVRQQLGKEIILIGCGGPWLESIGLFNGSRMTPDSANPPLPLGKMTVKINEGINTFLYRGAVAVAARRAIPFAKSFGMIFDGIHIDPNVPLGGRQKEGFNKSILLLRKLGISNMFVGDSLRNLPSSTKQKWKEFVQSFKAQNT